jgi:hypothetical protein
MAEMHESAFEIDLDSGANALLLVACGLLIWRSRRKK